MASKNDFVREQNYIRATQRVMKALENDDELMKSIANSDSKDRQDKIFGMIEKKFDNSDNMKRAIYARMNTSFKESRGDDAWKHRSINQILDDYKLDELQRKPKEEERRKEEKKIEDYEYKERTIRQSFERRKQETTSKFEKQIIDRQEKHEIIREQGKLSGAERVRLEMEGKLIL